MSFCGPGASEVLVDAVRKRQVPVIGGGTGIWSSIEITDAAAATLAAVDRGAPGVYNVVDSDPAPVAEWLRYLATVVGAKPPLAAPPARAPAPTESRPAAARTRSLHEIL
jgi:nucleoside-diphosphate-sugar epimerase